MKILLSTILVAVFLAGAALAASVDGKWTAQMPGRDGQTREVVYNFKVDGGKLTGTVGAGTPREVQISDGKVSGDTISFTTKFQSQKGEFVMQYKGQVSGDEIKFTVGRPGGEQTREFTAKRAK